MTARRVANRELVETLVGTPTAPPSRRVLLGRALASPWGVLIVFPALVLAVGLFLTLVGQRALKVSNVSQGERRLAEQAQLAGQQLGTELAAADPMLDRLADFAAGASPEQALEPVAAVLLDVMSGHAGVAYVSISFPDGTFQGAYVDRDGTARFQDSRVGASGTRVRRFDYAGHAALKPYREETTAYDPRQRDFYKLALGAGGRVWTKPYPFYKSHYTGVTRAMPVYVGPAGGRHLQAVVTVDFDVNELSHALHAGELPNMRTLLFTDSGALLAYPQAEKRISALPLGERVLTYRELNDSTLNGFFAALPGRAAPRTGRVQFEAGGTPYLAMLAPVSEAAALDWKLAYLVPEDVFFQGLHRYSRRAFAIAALSVLLALGLAVTFARLVVRVRREAAQARAEAKRAHQAARELGSYRLVQCLGRGGMGEVWRAEHRLLAREAAIKLIRMDGDAAVSDEARERFRREAQALAALRSRNTIELFDYGVAGDGTFFYVMELLDGLDLETLVTQYGPQPPGRVASLLMQACRSLAEAHDVGVVHRDIKPANLFVCRVADEVDVVKVLDFGLVRGLSDSESEDAAPLSTEQVRAQTSESEPDFPEPQPDGKLTRAGSVMGTPDFMAPEQALGRALDGRADLYALGCVGYWLLTGRPLFRKPNAMTLLLAHIKEPPPPLERYARGVPRALKLCIMDCLAKAPEHRPQTARELWRRLSEAQAELGPDERFAQADAEAWWREHRPARRTSLSASLGTPPRASEVVAADGDG